MKYHAESAKISVQTTHSYARQSLRRTGLWLSTSYFADNIYATLSSKIVFQPIRVDELMMNWSCHGLVSSRGSILVTKDIVAKDFLARSSNNGMALKSQVYDDCPNVVVDDQFTFGINVSILTETKCQFDTHFHQSCLLCRLPHADTM